MKTKQKNPHAVALGKLGGSANFKKQGRKGMSQIRKGKTRKVDNFSSENLV